MFIKRLNCFLLLGLLYSTALHAQSDIQYPKNIVLIIGDGMGLAHIGMYSHVVKHPLAVERMPVIGLQKTHSASHLITDSGAAATAMACGVKTYNSAIGMRADTTPCTNLFELANAAGLGTGLVVTSSLVHATPGAFVSHQQFRGFREAIATDYVDAHLDYVVGGGLMYFTNRFTDDRNIRHELEEAGYNVFDYNEMSFKNFSKRQGDKMMYFTSHLEPDRRVQGRTYFPKAVHHGMQWLGDHHTGGYFMMVEASQIDYAGHDNDKHYLLGEMRDFEEMLTLALDLAESDGQTLVIVTADHSTGGLQIEEGKPGKANVKFGFETTRHTADMVPVYAFGPGAELFHGMYDNTDIFRKIVELGRYLDQ